MSGLSRKLACKVLSCEFSTRRPTVHCRETRKLLLVGKQVALNAQFGLVREDPIAVHAAPASQGIRAAGWPGQRTPRAPRQVALIPLRGFGEQGGATSTGRSGRASSASQIARVPPAANERPFSPTGNAYSPISE